MIGLIRKMPTLDSRLQRIRRRNVAKTNGYPNWKGIIETKILSVVGKKSEKRSDRKSKVLIGTSIGSHLPAVQVESVLAVALRLRNADVEVLLCDGILKACQMCEPRFFPSMKHFIMHGPTKMLCDHCFKPGARCFQDIGVEVKRYSSFLSSEDYIFADATSEKIQLKEIEKFVFKGLKLGEHAKAGALRYFASATLDESDSTNLVLRRFLSSAILTAIGVTRLFENNKYDVVVFHHGIYVPQGIIGEVARRMGVRVVNWNPAYRSNCFIFSHGDTYHHTMMNEPATNWERVEWNDSVEKKIDLYLASRWHGSNDWIHFLEKPCFSKDKIIKEIGCNFSKPIVGCLTNVMWDAQLHYPANAFPNMLEWLLHTIQYFSKRQDIQLVIRVHPAEIRGSIPSRQPVVQEIRKRLQQLPPNVFLIPPESNISTYVLAEICDSVIIYATKTGVELTSVGIPVIVAGEAWVRNKGLTVDVESIKHYDSILARLPLGKRLEAETVLRAKKYAYHFFFRRMIPIKSFSSKMGWPPYHFIGNLSDLQEKSDSGLDCICDGILNGSEFVFEP